MEVPAHRRWMYNRLHPGRRGHTTEFLKGVEEFMKFACEQKKYLDEGLLRCPCKLCKNENHLSRDLANTHIHQHGFTPEYWNWTCHGEAIFDINDGGNDDIDMAGGDDDIDMAEPSSSQQWNYQHLDRYQDMVFDAAGFNRDHIHSNLSSNLKLLNSNINSFNPSPNHIHNLNILNLTLYQLNLNRNHDLNPLNLTLCQINLNHNHDLNPLNLTLFQTNLNPLNLTLCQINLNHNHDLNPFNLTLYQLNLNHNPLNLTLCQINHYPIHLNILVDPSLLKLWSMKPHLPLAILVETPKLKFQYSPMGMEIAHLIRSHLEEGKPSWKQLSGTQRNTFFDLFQKKEKGEDPSFSEFYFRTHRKRDQSWVGGVAQSAYEKFEQKKQEISSQNTFVSGEDEVNSQPNMPPDMDIWVDTVGKKKMRVFGLGSLSKSLISSSNQSTSANTREVDDLRSQVHALNASLQRQAQEKEQMMQQLQRQDQEMKETNQKLSSLMQHLGFTGSSSHPPQANNEKFTNEDEDGNQ